jgi:hypothetical protein
MNQTNGTNCVTFTPNLTLQSNSNLIYKKMSQVMSEIGSVTKDQKNQAQGFKFRGIDQFVNAMYPALVRNGVFMAPRCISETHELKEVQRSSGKNGVDKHVTIMMEYRFFCEDGSSVVIGPIPAEGLDSGDKATNKALSAALKYALIQTFSVPTEDMAEADLETPEIGVQRKTTPQTAPVLKTPAVGTETITLSPEVVEAQIEATVEPVKKSSFRKTKPEAAQPAQTTTESSSDWS